MPVILGHSGSKLSRGPLGGAAHGAVSFSSAVSGAAGGVPGAPVRLAHPCGRRLGSLRCRLREGSCLRGLDPKLPSGLCTGWVDWGSPRVLARMVRGPGRGRFCQTDDSSFHLSLGGGLVRGGRKGSAVLRASGGMGRCRAPREASRGLARLRVSRAVRRGRQAGGFMRRMREKHARLRRCNTSIRMATWNMRGLGVTGGETDQELKVKVLLTRMAEQQWDIVCLTDLQFPEDGIREYHFGGREWFLLVRGMVGFLLSDVWYDWWEQGGGVVYQRRTRAAAISIPRRGWRRGLWICSVYAPTSASGVRERTALRQEVSVLVEAAPPTTMVIIAGDFNAEMGNNVDVSRSGHSIMGPFAGPKVTKPGAEWRDWCERNGFREAGSRFKQRRRCTWRHPRYRSDHELDHFLVREQDLWHLQSCRILYDGPSVNLEGPLLLTKQCVVCSLTCC